MINVKDGSVSFDGGLLIKKKMYLDEIASTDIKSINEYGYTSVLLNPQNVDGEEMVVRLYFDLNKRLEGVSLALKGAYSDWSEWSIEEELRLDERQKSWLFRQIGSPPYAYKWGTIWAGYDSKSASSSIYINYGKRKQRLIAQLKRASCSISTEPSSLMLYIPLTPSSFET